LNQHRTTELVRLVARGLAQVPAKTKNRLSILCGAYFPTLLIKVVGTTNLEICLVVPRKSLCELLS
jgi:hypothetical protein